MVDQPTGMIYHKEILDPTNIVNFFQNHLIKEPLLMMDILSLNKVDRVTQQVDLCRFHWLQGLVTMIQNL